MRDDWKDKEITEKQRACIADMQEFSMYPLPKFTGTTRGEANEYIAKWASLAFDNVNSPTWGY